MTILETLFYFAGVMASLYLVIGVFLAIKLHQPKMIYLWFVLLLGSGVQ